MTATLDQTPGRHAAADPGAAAFVERLHALEVTAVRLAEERDAALARARRAEADAAAQFRVNLELQRALDERAAVDDTMLRAEAESHAVHVAELLEERRAWLLEKARLEAENGRLRCADTLVLPRYVQTRRGRWRSR